MTSDLRPRYWRNNLRLIGALLFIGFAVTFGVAFFARELDFRFAGWPFSYWMGSQGALLVYLGIVCVYAWGMERLDRSHGVDEAPED
jgi:putative solute:sodium symporter small subunit